MLNAVSIFKGEDSVQTVIVLMKQLKDSKACKMVHTQIFRPLPEFQEIIQKCSHVKLSIIIATLTTQITLMKTRICRRKPLSVPPYGDGVIATSWLHV